jgi:hypothetical protein
MFADEQIFVTKRRSPSGVHDPIGRSGLLKLLRESRSRVGMRKMAHQCLFRHGIATEAFSRGMGPMIVEPLPGYSCLGMSESKYSHADSDDLCSAVIAMLKA